MTFTLETKQLILRPFTPDDFEAVHAWASNPDNVRYMAWGPNTEAQTREFLSETRAGVDFAVVLKETDTVIGSGGLYPEEGETGHMGWILHMDYWKRGFGAEFVKELIRYGFEDLKLRRLYAPCAADNYGSCRVMERNGMRREATHKKAFWARIDEEWIDNACYAILAEEYFSVVAIRHAALADLPQLLELYQQLQPADLPVDIRTANKVFAQALQGGVTYFVADDHGRIAATCCIAIIPNLTRQCAPIGFVENIVTHRDYRRQGLGRRVLEAAIAFARARGCYKVLLQSGIKRTEAHRLYEAAGMDGDTKRAFELRL